MNRIQNHCVVTDKEGNQVTLSIMADELLDDESRRVRFSFANAWRLTGPAVQYEVWVNEHKSVYKIPHGICMEFVEFIVGTFGEQLT